MISLLEFSSRSFIRRLSNSLSDTAGFRSISALRVEMSLLPAIFAEALRTIGPLIPRCVKSISPKSSNTFLPFSSRIEMATFLRVSPASFDTKCSFICKDVRDGTQGFTFISSFLANLNPSPVEPVDGYESPPVATITRSAGSSVIFLLCFIATAHTIALCLLLCALNISILVSSYSLELICSFLSGELSSLVRISTASVFSITRT